MPYRKAFYYTKDENFFFINTLVKILMAQDGAKNLKRDLFKTYDSQSRPIQDSNFSLDICVGNIIYLKFWILG